MRLNVANPSGRLIDRSTGLTHVSLGAHRPSGRLSTLRKVFLTEVWSAKRLTVAND